MDRKHFIQLAAKGVAMASVLKPSDISAFLSNTKSNKLPAVFIGHGSPMNALANNAFTLHLNQLGQNMERPKAILVISAHWLTTGTHVSINPNPETIYDFGGFPQALFEVKYPAPGAPEFAKEVAKAITTTAVHHDHEMGLDHGAWTILKHIYPKADIPVFQMSIDYSKPASYHYELAKELDNLRSKGLLIISSGNIVHNLRAIKWQEKEPTPYEWATEFDELSKKYLLEKNHQPLLNWQNLGTAARNSIPTPDHYYPLMYSLGLQGKEEQVKFIHEEMQMASVSLRSFIVS